MSLEKNFFGGGDKKGLLHNARGLYYTRAATRTRISSLGGTYFIPLNYPGEWRKYRNIRINCQKNGFSAIQLDRTRKGVFANFRFEHLPNSKKSSVLERVLSEI